MKPPLFFVLACLLVFSCKEETKTAPVPLEPDAYIISGTAPGLVNGLRAYLKSTNEKGFLKVRDTAIIMNEFFVFDGKVELAEAWFLEVNSLDGSFPFVIDNSALVIEVNKEDIQKSKIEGNAINNSISNFNTQLKKLNDSLNNTSERYRERIIKKESVAGMSNQVRDLKDVILRFPHEFIKNNTDSPYGLVLLNTMIRRNSSDKGMIVASFDRIDESLKNSYLGQRVSKSIPEIRNQYDIIAATHIGKIAPNFSAPSPNGKTIELNDVKGKATLIHFWSSWYKASRRDNVRLVKLYEKYHDKGLEMIGISLDGNATQKNPKSDWKKAIKEDQLIWDQISNLNYFNDTISKTYSVRSLPASFILNSEGVIVAKNLTGNSLDAKLKELLE
ncbi:TlpA disulfide reductase family protein [Psychroserpens jangbogonensis]|uniref:TlpA disulfide reductase family protein n=1 Tax=Psychroserpens jangbogonensis TaxID=1484460 RepID=UPI00053E7511|nr:TlpA disulfide reductase family protein [Psychroserpens jangbogonensis]